MTMWPENRVLFEFLEIDHITDFRLPRSSGVAHVMNSKRASLFGLKWRLGRIFGNRPNHRFMAA